MSRRPKIGDLDRAQDQFDEWRGDLDTWIDDVSHVKEMIDNFDGEYREAEDIISWYDELAEKASRLGGRANRTASAVETLSARALDWFGDVEVTTEIWDVWRSVNE